MKTYLLDSLNRYKRFSENLDVKTILCNKAWNIFNDIGKKEVYIFQENGDLIISINGEISDAKWTYIHANRSIRITSCDKSYLLNPFFFDDIIFSLQLDGTEKYIFMIDESKKEQLAIKSLVDITAHVKEVAELKSQMIQKEIINMDFDDTYEFKRKLTLKLLSNNREYLELGTNTKALFFCAFFLLVILLITIVVLVENEQGNYIFFVFLLFVPVVVMFVRSNQSSNKRSKIFREVYMNVEKELLEKKTGK